MGPGVASECIETKDGPVIWEDHFYPEIIDPETGAVLPDGEEGELVFTTLTKEALPVIRYRTRDLTRLLPPTARCMRRMGKIVGRSDDMLIIRGVNVFPTQIEELVLQHGQLSGQYQLVVTRDGTLDEMQVLCELLPDHASADRAAIAGALQQRIKTLIGISTTVQRGRARIDRTHAGRQGPPRDRQATQVKEAKRMYTQAMDTMARRKSASARPCARPRRASSSSASTRRSTPATSSRPRTGCPITTARRCCARSASTRTREIVGMLPEGNWISARRRSSARRSCWPRCRTKAATACICTPRPRRWAPAATRWSMRCTRGKAKYSSIFNYPTLTWADIGTIGWLVDGAAIMNQVPICRCSLRAVCARDDPHLPRGELSPAPGLRQRC